MLHNICRWASCQFSPYLLRACQRHPRELVMLAGNGMVANVSHGMFEQFMGVDCRWGVRCIFSPTTRGDWFVQAAVSPELGYGGAFVQEYAKEASDPGRFLV
ncbi:unnamed protein product [Prorocentrum cordatum]|uniref:Uncharacterized protein n=1 Tax=Prorocentrum cordatum TaxID=2364126 RepID=A0ABN9WMD2_9DINO|nr:unnamed protein product [Polarella glacialis]